MHFDFGDQCVPVLFYFLPPWDEDLGRRLVWDVIQRQRELFSRFPDVDQFDLMSEGLQRARDAHPGFDRGRGAYSTFIEGCVHRRYIDMWRKRSRGAVRETKVALAIAGVHRTARLSHHEDIENNDLPLAEWLGLVYRTARARLGCGFVRRGRKWYSPAQAAACLALKQRLNLSFASLADLLADREDLRAAMHLRHKPSLRACERFVKKIQDFTDKFPRGDRQRRISGHVAQAKVQEVRSQKPYSGDPHRAMESQVPGAPR
jgi:hypothetical protein